MSTPTPTPHPPTLQASSTQSHTCWEDLKAGERWPTLWCALPVFPLCHEENLQLCSVSEVWLESNLLLLFQWLLYWYRGPTAAELAKQECFSLCFDSSGCGMGRGVAETIWRVGLKNPFLFSRDQSPQLKEMHQAHLKKTGKNFGQAGLE